MFQRFIQDESGATAIEYALISSLIAIAILASMRAVGDANIAMYEQINTAVQNASNGAP